MLQIMFDDKSLGFVEQYQNSRGDQDPIQAQLRLDNARQALAGVLLDLENPGDAANRADADGDVNMNGGVHPDAEVVTIPLTVDDELADIPAELRAQVIVEIAQFRERSHKRDLERLKREEEEEARERARTTGQRVNRLASPPLAAPVGPAGGANGIPVGPRAAATPTGPKGYGAQIPRDYQQGVNFVNGTGINGAAAGWIDREDEDSEASDEELERRRKEKKSEQEEKLYLDAERRWLNREKSRTAAIEREKARDQEEALKRASEKEAVAKRLAEWDDKLESERKEEQYYSDRSLWLRNRAIFREREKRLDDLDRAAEERERAREEHSQNVARGMADDFLNRQAEELDAKQVREPQRFKLSLGAAAQKAQAAAATSKRTVAEVEGLLEDEEEAADSARRTLIPIKFDSTAEAAGLTEEERKQAVRQLAAEIPNDKEGLWKWIVKWEYVDDGVVREQLKPFVEKKIVEYLGVQEQMLVEVVEDHVRSKGGPGELVELLAEVSLCSSGSLCSCVASTTWLTLWTAGIG
jgi:hypothetical protein